MVFEEFLRDLRSLQLFFAQTGFITQFLVFADIAANAKSGAAPGWRQALSERYAEIDKLIFEFERTSKTILQENKALGVFQDGGLVFDYRSEVDAVFQDVITADAEIKALVTRLEAMRDRSDAVLTSLEALGVKVSEPPEKDASNGVTFEFRFESDVSNLRELGLQATNLNKHIKALARLDQGQIPHDIEIIVLSKASPLLVQAWIAERVTKVLNQMLALILDNAKKVQEIRLYEQDIKAKKIDNEMGEVELALRKRRAQLEAGIIDSITQELLGEYPAEAANGARNEVEKDVKTAVKYFASQTSKGLEVRILPAAEELASEEGGRRALEYYTQRRQELSSLRDMLPSGPYESEEPDNADLHDEPTVEPEEESKVSKARKKRTED